MISLSETNKLTRWFIWCCNNLPGTVTYEYAKGKGPERRTGEYYLTRGTTLCHLFWATFWVPLFYTAFTSFVGFVLVMTHIAFGVEYSPRLGLLAYFMPEGIILAITLILCLLVFGLIGVRTSVLWQYLYALKARVCPLVNFSREQE